MAAPTSFVFFGDSLTDAGAFFAATDAALTTPFPLESEGYARRATNGPVYAELFPDRLDALRVENYAVAGARVSGSTTIADFVAVNAAAAALVDPSAPDEAFAFDLDLAAQVARFQADQAADPVTDALAVFLVGLNDFRDLIPLILAGDPAPLTAEAERIGADYGAALGAVAAEPGIQRVAVVTFPDGGLFPLLSPDVAGPALALEATAFTESFNEQIRLFPDLFGASGLDVQVIDLERLMDEIAADPETYGFPDLFATRYLGSGAEVVPDGAGGFVYVENPAGAGLADERLAFWDQLHPSAELHQIWSAFFAASVEHRVTFLGELSETTTLSGPESDLLLAFAGDDVARGSKGDDTLLGGLGDDLLFGNGFSDLLSGGAGDDTLRGDFGADLLAGAAGDDVLIGGRGRDVLVGGTGADTLRGDIGDDLFLFTDPALLGAAAGGDLINGAADFDTLVLTVAAENRAAAESLAAGATGSELVFEALGLTVRQVERIVVLGSGEGPPDFKALGYGGATGPGRLLAEAEIWGLLDIA
ncbi:MAG: SGNH/GDSL hydrolase family protein [Pseudomonadota bacterium]